MSNSKTLKNLSLLVFSISTLCGCGAKEVKPESLYQALELLTTTKNYTFNQMVGDEIARSYVVSENAVGCFNKKHLEQSDFYLVADKGLYNVTYEDGYRKSEYILNEDGDYIKDLFANDYIKTLYGVDIEDVISDPSASSLTVKSRDFKLGFLGIVGLSSTNYADIEYVKANFNGILELEVKFFDKKDVYSYEVDDFGTSSIPYADQQVKRKSGAFIPDEDLSAMRALIKGNNFKLDSYDVIEEKFYAQEWLNQNYWFSTYGNYGYVAMNHVTDKADPDDKDVKGCYMFQVQDGQLGFYGNPLSDTTDIAEFENYPSKMKTLNNLQYLTKGDYELKSDYKYNGEVYSLTNKTLVYDVLGCFGLLPSKASDGSVFKYAEPRAIVMDIDIDPIYDIGDEKAGKTEITYIYVFDYNGTEYDMYLPMHSFGEASIPALDKYLETFNNGN